MATTVTLKPNAIDISGSTSGTTTLQATAVAGTTTLTLPAATDTLVGRATTDTLTNKTLTGAAITSSTGAFTTLTSTGASSFATSSGDVGIGTSSPQSLLNTASTGQVQIGTASWPTNFVGKSNARTIIGNEGLLILWNDAAATAGNEAALYIGPKGSGTNGSTIIAGGYVKGISESSSTNNGALTFGTNSGGGNAERARFNSTGAFVFAGGTTTADGIGITFPATQSASTNANTLDDYEEGTWTPDDQSGASLSFTIYNATYTKVGRLVQIQASITYPSTASILDAQIGGLPFNSASGTDNTSGICLVGTNVNLNFTGLIARNNTKFFLETISGASISNVNMSSKYIKFFGWYIV